MAQSQSLQPQEKKELVSQDEKTIPVRYFVPATDIFETEDALTVVMEMPGVDRGAIDIAVESGTAQEIEDGGFSAVTAAGVSLKGYGWVMVHPAGGNVCQSEVTFLG